MKYSRRELCFWIPALMASRGLAAEGPIPSKLLRFEDLPAETVTETRFAASSRARLTPAMPSRCTKPTLRRAPCRIPPITTRTKKSSWCAKGRWKSPSPAAPPAWAPALWPTWLPTKSTASGTPGPRTRSISSSPWAANKPRRGACPACRLPAHLSFSYSSLACFKTGMSGSASFQKARKS